MSFNKILPLLPKRRPDLLAVQVPPQAVSAACLAIADAVTTAIAIDDQAATTLVIGDAVTTNIAISAHSCGEFTMAVNNHDVGDVILFTALFTDAVSGAAVDPTAVFFGLRDPSGNLATYQYTVDAEVIKNGVGDYKISLAVDETGTWSYRWYSTGTGQASEEQLFRVRQLQTVAAV